MTRLRGPQLIEELKSLRTDIDTLKSAQMIGGDSLLGYLMSSSNLNDFSFTIVVGTNRNFNLTLTPVNNNFLAIADLYLFYSIDQPDVMANAVPPWASATVNMAVQKLPPASNTNQWYLAFQNADGVGTPHTVYLKWIYSATDAGT